MLTLPRAYINFTDNADDVDANVHGAYDEKAARPLHRWDLCRLHSNGHRRPDPCRARVRRSSSGRRGATVDPAEIAKFERMAAEWWDADGKFRPLHRFNPVRIGYVRDVVAAHFGRDAKGGRPLAGLRLLDIGCGGGILSEPMARLGRRGGRARSVRDERRGRAAARRGRAASPSTIGRRRRRTSPPPAKVRCRARHGGGRARRRRRGLHRRRRGPFEAGRPALRRHHKPHAEIVRARYRRRRVSPALAAARHARLREAGAAGGAAAGAHQAPGSRSMAETGLRYNPLTDRWSRSTDMDVNYVMVASKAARRSGRRRLSRRRIAPRRFAVPASRDASPLLSGPMTLVSETVPVGRWAAFQNRRLHEVLAVAARLELRRADPDRRGRLAGLRPDPQSASTSASSGCRSSCRRCFWCW